MATTAFSIAEALRFGWTKTKEHFALLLSAMAIMAVIRLGLSFVLDQVKEQGLTEVVVGLVAAAINMLLMMGFMRICLRLYDGQPAMVSELFSTYPLLFRYVVASLLYGVMVILGLLLLIVPGIIIGIRFQFYTPLIVDRGLGPVEALQQSLQVTKGVVWELFLFGVVTIGLNMLGALFFLIGLLLTFPVTILAAIFVYRHLLQRQLAAESLVTLAVAPPSVTAA